MFFSQPVRYEHLGFGDLVAPSTMAKMASIIKESSRNYMVRELASSIVENGPEKDQRFEVESIFRWFKNRYRYVKDPHGTEMLQSPLVAIQKWSNNKIWSGDCDDATIVLLSLYKSIGYPVAIRAASYRPDGKLTHVYGLVSIYNIWIPIDGIKINGQVGWEAPKVTKTKDVKV